MLVNNYRVIARVGQTVKDLILRPLASKEVLSNNVRMRASVIKFGDMPTRETIMITETFDFAQEFAGHISSARFIRFIPGGNYARSTWIPRMRQEIESICL